ncbi:alpha-amidating enzyme precursor 2 [Biomphalaria glabrata]|nr:alpha-amidating enzyme precursor 2 [Biomphalaria glabrata]
MATMKEVIEVKPGDALAVRCTYNSSSMDHPVGVGSVADPSGECAFNELTQLTGKNFTIDVSVPLPPNPALEEAAIGSHNHAGMNHPGEANVDFEDTQILKILMLGASPRKPDSYLCTAYHAQDLESYIYKFEAVADANRAHHMLLYGCEDAEDKDHSGLKIYVTHKKQPYVAGVFFLASASFTIPQGHSSFPVDVGCRFSKEKSIFPFAYKPHAHGLDVHLEKPIFNSSWPEESITFGQIGVAQENGLHRNF